MSEPAAPDGPQPRPHWLSVIAIGRNPRNTLIRIGILVVTVFVVFRYVLMLTRVDGISMLPTYHNRSIKVINRLAYLWHEPQRGDVVTVRLAGIHDMYLKRIIGLPGETVAFDGGTVLINGQPLTEPYEKSECHWTLPPKKLGPDEYYVVGDNRTMRWQDHSFGSVDRARIMGKVLI